jgi:hypothetical protein
MSTQLATVRNKMMIDLRSYWVNYLPVFSSEIDKGGRNEPRISFIRLTTVSHPLSASPIRGFPGF